VLVLSNENNTKDFTQIFTIEHGTSKLWDPLVFLVFQCSFHTTKQLQLWCLSLFPPFPSFQTIFFLTKHTLTMAKLKYFQKLVLDENGLDLIQPEITAQAQKIAQVIIKKILVIH